MYLFFSHTSSLKPVGCVIAYRSVVKFCEIIKSAYFRMQNIYKTKMISRRTFNRRVRAIFDPREIVLPVVLQRSESLENLPMDINEASNHSLASCDELVADLPLVEPSSELLKNKIREWSINHNVTHACLNDLLKILKDVNGYDIPQDSRTLMETPKTVKTEYVTENTPSEENYTELVNLNSSENLYIGQNATPNLQSSHASGSNSEIQTIRNELKEVQEIVLNHTAKMEVLIALILSKLGPGANAEVDGVNFNEFPLKTSSEIEELERKLRSDVTYKSNLVQKLSKFGGTDGTKTARTIAKFLFTDEVLLDYSWAGTAKKKNFSSFLEINSLISDAVRKLYATFTACDNANFFKEHLKHAKTRLARCPRQGEKAGTMSLPENHA